jgi:hypothetical protein
LGVRLTWSGSPVYLKSVSRATLTRSFSDYFKKSGSEPPKARSRKKRGLQSSRRKRGRGNNRRQSKPTTRASDRSDQAPGGRGEHGTREGHQRGKLARHDDQTGEDDTRPARRKENERGRRRSGHGAPPGAATRAREEGGAKNTHRHLPVGAAIGEQRCSIRCWRYGRTLPSQPRARAFMAKRGRSEPCSFGEQALVPAPNLWSCPCRRPPPRLAPPGGAPRRNPARPVLWAARRRVGVAGSCVLARGIHLKSRQHGSLICIFNALFHAFLSPGRI